MKNLTLRQWLDLERGRVTTLSNELQKHHSWISNIANGRKKAPLATALQISKLTKNQVSIEAISNAYKK
ncbi:hypothetical protein AB8Q18_04610 [Neisseriaceae bacterium CLB008]